MQSPDDADLAICPRFDCDRHQIEAARAVALAAIGAVHGLQTRLGPVGQEEIRLDQITAETIASVGSEGLRPDRGPSDRRAAQLAGVSAPESTRAECDLGVVRRQPTGWRSAAYVMGGVVWLRVLLLTERDKIAGWLGAG